LIGFRNHLLKYLAYVIFIYYLIFSIFAIALFWGLGSRGAAEQGSRGAGEQGSRGAGEQGSKGELLYKFFLLCPSAPLPLCPSAYAPCPMPIN